MLSFFSYLNSVHPLSDEATAALLKVVRAKELRRGQVWLQEGATCDKMTFVVKGLLKLYFETGSKEVIISFAKENEFMVSAQSYFSSVPSPYIIRCVEQSVVVYVLKSDFDHLMERYFELNKHYLFIAQDQVTKIEKHAGLLLMPPKERYQTLLAERSWMVTTPRLTDSLLGGYLGIGCNGLGRWRKGMD